MERGDFTMKDDFLKTLSHDAKHSLCDSPQPGAGQPYASNLVPAFQHSLQLPVSRRGPLDGNFACRDTVLSGLDERTWLGQECEPESNEVYHYVRLLR